MIVISLIILIVAILILALVLWNALAWPAVGDADRRQSESLSVLIPARDEEANIAACLASVLRQGETVGEVLVYDDHSEDATAQIIKDFAERDSRVHLVRASKLPDGWCGKNFACAQLADAANGEWLLFLDADARLSKDGAARMMAEAHCRDLTLLSCWPGLTLAGFWEKALMPMLNFVVLTLFPAPLSLIRQDASLGIAHGACLLVHRASYLEMGGHEAVRDQIFEDTRLAQLWRERGNRGLCLDGREAVSVRMYGSFIEIWAGFQKNFYPAFRRDRSFWTFLILHLTIFLSPFLLIPFLAFGSIEMWLILGAVASVLVMRALLAIRFRHPLWSVLLHPLAEMILIALGLSSWWRCKRGRGVQWKGRYYQKAGSREL